MRLLPALATRPMLPTAALAPRWDVSMSSPMVDDELFTNMAGCVSGPLDVKGIAFIIASTCAPSAHQRGLHDLTTAPRGLHGLM